MATTRPVPTSGKSSRICPWADPLHADGSPVNEKWKTAAQSIGLEPGIFDDTAGYPHQLYVREARRMQASTVVTQADMEGRTDPDDSVGLASYGVDEWPYATYPLDGKVALAGGYYSMLTLDEVHRGIYKISYRAIVPRQQQCTNLLVPVCLSASHIAMTSIRMEPVWMILGESAGVAAAMAVAGRLPVQQIDITSLQGNCGTSGRNSHGRVINALPQRSPGR